MILQKIHAAAMIQVKYLIFERKGKDEIIRLGRSGLGFWMRLFSTWDLEGKDGGLEGHDEE